MGSTDGVGKALAIDLAPSEHKGAAIGILGTTTGLATIIASTSAGLLWDLSGNRYPFFLSALVAGLAAGLVLFWKTYEPKGVKNKLQNI